MSVYSWHSDPTPEKLRERIAKIVGCHMVDGACVTHQARRWEPRRPGCPYLDLVLSGGDAAEGPASAAS